MGEALNISVGVDWGSSSFRAYRFDAAGQIIDRVESADGIKFVDRSDFESVLLSHTGSWLQCGDTVLLSGMITSRNGWVETPYLSCPLKLVELLRRSTSKAIAKECTLRFLPGACIVEPADVMRGEELQLYGALQNKAASEMQLVVLPGTHSKWAVVKDGTLQKFHTVATGELFDVLVNQTLIGGLASELDFIAAAFADGVRSGYSTDAIVSQLFTARSKVLLDQMPATDVHSYLSGLLIGNEIKESQSLSNTSAPVLIVGSGTLCTRYAQALDLLQIQARVESRDAAGLGFLKLIQHDKSEQ